MTSSLLLKGWRGVNRLKARTGLLVDLDLGHRSTRQIGTVYRINPRFSDLKLYNYVQTSEFHPPWSYFDYPSSRYVEKEQNVRESSAEMRNDHTPGTEHFTDMLQNENTRRLGPTVEGPRCEAVWAAPLRTVCCIFPAVTWKDARLAPLLVWDTP